MANAGREYLSNGTNNGIAEYGYPSAPLSRMNSGEPAPPRKRFMRRKDDIHCMDPLYLMYFLGFGLIFGTTGTIIVHAAQYFPVERKIAGLMVFLFGCAVSIYYRLQMPPTPFVPISFLTTATGFLIHPLFLAAGVLVISGLTRYYSYMKVKTIFLALFLSAGISSILGPMGFYKALSLALNWLHPIIPSLLNGIIKTCLAMVVCIGLCELLILLETRQTSQPEER